MLVEYQCSNTNASLICVNAAAGNMHMVMLKQRAALWFCKLQQHWSRAALRLQAAVNNSQIKYFLVRTLA